MRPAKSEDCCADGLVDKFICRGLRVEGAVWSPESTNSGLAKAASLIEQEPESKHPSHLTLPPTPHPPSDWPLPRYRMFRGTVAHHQTSSPTATEEA